MNIARLLLLKLLLISAFFFAVFVLVYAAAAAPTLEGRRLGLRGLKRKRAIQNVPMWATAEPVVRWLGARVSGLVSPDARIKMDRQIALAGDYMGLLPEEAVGFSVVSAIAGVLAGMLFGWLTGMGSVLIIAGAGMGALMPYMQITSTATDRMKNVNRRLPYAIDLLALAMGAGLDFPGAVKQVIDKSGDPEQPVVEEFTLILQSLQLGRTRTQALEEFAARVPTDSVVEFVGSVVQAETRGNPVVDVLRIQAEVSRRKRSVRAEEAASKAGVAMVGPLVLVFIAILLLIVSPIAMKLSDSSSGM
jgi:tight adherence protein C